MSLLKISLLGMAALTWASPMASKNAPLAAIKARDTPPCYPQTMTIGTVSSQNPHQKIDILKPQGRYNMPQEDYT
jgi:hypothetical protein